MVEFKVGPMELITTRGKYDIIETDYQNYALIYSCSKRFGIIKNEFAWILSRSRTLDPAIIARLKQTLSQYTDDIDKFLIADQTNC